MKQLLFLVLGFLSFSAIAQSLKPFDFDEMANANASIRNLSSFGFSDDEFPSQASLTEYALVSKQRGGSCVGFSVCGAMNIMHNYINEQTEYDAKYIHRFDPYFLYCSLKDSEDIACIGEDCDCGAYIDDALELLKSYGAKKSALTPRLDCGNQLSKGNLRAMSSFTEAYTIDDFYNLCDYEKIDGQWEVIFDLDRFRWALSNSYPIVTGIDVADGFDDVTGELALYSAPEGATEGHAVTIVGYDDNYNGGAFQFLNSYGDEWGDNGFFWMTYDDYILNASAAYIMSNDEWDSWSIGTTIASDAFYRGYDAGGDSFWEGPLNPEGYFHGQGVEMTTEHYAIGNYTDGYRDGWWLLLQKMSLDDPWSGLVLFDNGEVIESESFGFSSSNDGKDEFTTALDLGCYGVSIEESSVLPSHIEIGEDEPKAPK